MDETEKLVILPGGLSRILADLKQRRGPQILRRELSPLCKSSVTISSV